MTCAVYICRGEQQDVLYVGISDSPFRRLAQHEASADWARSAFFVEIAWFPSRAEAMAEERRAIGELNPIHNIARPVQSAVREILDAMSGKQIERMLDALKVKERSIRLAKERGVFPASWFFVVRKFCAEAGIDCPNEAFNFRIPTSHRSTAASCDDSHLAGNANGSAATQRQPLTQNGADDGRA